MSISNTDHHVLKEILSQPEIWQRTLAWVQAGGIRQKLWSMIGRGPIVFAGCGSSYYVSLATSPIWNGFGAAPASALSATDLMLYPDGYWRGHPSGTLIAVSRSGKTVETCEATRHARTLGWHAVGATCYRDTPLIGACEESLVLTDAAEVSRFTTRAWTAMVLMFEMLLALHTRNEELQRELLQLPEDASRLLARYHEQIRDIARKGTFQDYVYLGQGPYFGVASELALKTKEMVRTSAVAYPSLEFLHGPRYAATSSTLIVVLLSDGGSKYQLQLLPKMKPLGAKIAVVCERAVAEVSANADFVLELESGLSDYARMLLMVPLLQLFAYHRALAVGKSSWIEQMINLPARSPQIS
ncbi:MAG TPA: SIS domain-containing protein [Terriglobales bacterium]|nr:SIS domain-containing protein [Terriglobales bacterium]